MTAMNSTVSDCQIPLSVRETDAQRSLALVTDIISPYRIPVFNALARHRGIDLNVVFLTDNDPSRQWPVYKDEIRFPYLVLPSWCRRFGKHNLLLNRGLRAALRHATPDTIVCGGYNFAACWQALWWARHNRVPFLLWSESTANDLRGGHPLPEFLKRKFIRACDAFVVPGKSAWEYITSFGISEERIFRAPNAVDTALFARGAETARRDLVRRRALSLPTRFFLFVGRLIKEKGVFDLIEAYSRLSPELRDRMGLVLVGDGKARVELQRRAAVIKPGSLHFPGFVHREHLPSYYGLAETFVFPTYTDTWGLVVNEALACGLPIICTNVAGCAADLVQDGVNGRIVPAGDVSQLAAAMEDMMRDAGGRSRMSAHSKLRILNYSPEACADGMAEAALSFAGRKRE
jgi:glycosyltransferase involved in cell wall biosynthesis